LEHVVNVEAIRKFCCASLALFGKFVAQIVKILNFSKIAIDIIENYSKIALNNS